MSSLILTLQEELVNALEADAFFDGIPILSRKKAELGIEYLNRIQRMTLGGAVFISSLGMSEPNIDKPHFDSIRIVAGFKENRTANVTGKTAEECAEKAAAILHHFQPDSISSPVQLDANSIIEIPPEDDKNPAVILWQVSFLTQGGISHVVPKLANPSIDNVGGTLTLSHVTPGAAIFYTTNGKNPVPRVGTLYTAPFAPGSVTVKARAWLAGYVASETEQLTL